MSLKERYERVLADVAKAPSAFGPATLIVVTKNHPAELVAELVDLGCMNVGENRDQEASAKYLATQELRPHNSLNWHFIGQLQTNKVKSVLRYASAIHSIDRSSLVQELAKQLPKLGRTVQGFIELNLTGDPGRGGVMPANLEALTEEVLKVPEIQLQGLMAVAGLGEEPRSEFERVLELQHRFLTIAPEARSLSMGMSEDYQVALELGATHIRVGSKITGPRSY
ncbi:YggS family pyridoxal phosphate-dependent enzyme [Aquiluna sp. KACHI24]|uniref:YggS family pyridoxal phosphate-dependent enzyme n=1 Tax=Aquiluna sp. KACHI24 TaxID=2968831 RepID=UPI00220D7331|nr:YggS family pyridoxal phosphate-dependent enzyme [Aquiluna sp. KACHI24]BDQ00186.1 YggS family pyridoxal phosphate enzyme [Aquiluna sp. KACHI24]